MPQSGAPFRASSAFAGSMVTAKAVPGSPTSAFNASPPEVALRKSSAPITCPALIAIAPTSSPPQENRTSRS